MAKNKRLLIKSTVVDVRRLTAEHTALTFRPVHRVDYPEYRAGAHTLVRLDDGSVRSYSLCGASSQREWRIGVRANGIKGSVAERLAHGTQVGDQLFLSYPQEAFYLDPSAERFRFVAGGIGITPILSMLYELHATATADRVVLHYFVPSHDKAVFLDELADLGVEVRVHAADRPDRPTAREVVAQPDPGEHLYFCGPPRMLRDIEPVLPLWQGHAYHELFGSSSDRLEAREAESFELQLVKSGECVRVGESESALQALLRSGVAIDYQCEGGVCGTCVVEVVDGVVDHRDDCLSDADRRSAMAPCVSRGIGVVGLLL
ncbi:PDR/VanB family oxidoreductase [Nocardia fluminea]|uniref:PDR/VanB family oxidoreductase n=1 Tax=Nocardia fluminea TaxID=134984 RepID=UPI00364B8536